MLYLKMQLLNYGNRKGLLRKTSGLKRFAAALQMKVFPSEMFEDVFYLELPDDQADACQLINAFEAYCYFYEVAIRVAFERETVPFIDFIKKLEKKLIK